MNWTKVADYDWSELISLKGVSVLTAAAVLLAGVTTAAVSHSVAAGNRVITGVKAEGTPINGTFGGRKNSSAYFCLRRPRI